MTAAAIYYVVEFLTFPLSVRNVCVFTAPFFASNTTIVAYLFGKEVKDEKTGLFAAFFIAIVPGMCLYDFISCFCFFFLFLFFFSVDFSFSVRECIGPLLNLFFFQQEGRVKLSCGFRWFSFLSFFGFWFWFCCDDSCIGYISRSVAGSYDNEGVAIFAMNLTFYLFVKAVNTGSLFWALNACMAYMYMVFAWGGYIFIINLIPLYVLYLIFTGRYSNRLYIAYSTFYVVGTILAMQVRFVNFQVC